MSHFIDMTDHFAHFDKSITIYNFLRYSDRVWRLIDNDIQPQNRMRLRDYLDMYERLGIPIITTSIKEGRVKDLRTVRVHEKYGSYRETELIISHAYVISGKSVSP